MAAIREEVVVAEVRRTAEGIVVQETVALNAIEQVIANVQNEAQNLAPAVEQADAVAVQLEQAASISLSPPEAHGAALPQSFDGSLGNPAAQAPVASEEITEEVLTPKAAPRTLDAATPSTAVVPSPVNGDPNGVAGTPTTVTAIPGPTSPGTDEALGTPVQLQRTSPSSPAAKPESGGVGSPAIAKVASTDGLETQSSLKDLPKVAVDAAKQAGQAYVDAGKEAKTTMKSLATAFLTKQGPPITLTLDHIVTAIFLVCVGFQFLILPVFLPGLFRLVYCLVWGLLLGLGLSFLFYLNKKNKRQANELLGTNLGIKGLYLVAGDLPSWLNMSNTEKLEWLNRLIGELWPYVDKGVCGMIKEITAQVMPGVLKTLPGGLSGIVKSIGFKHLTFGDAPFRVESMWVGSGEKDLVVELSVKWCGDPNITLAIEVPGGQKLCPRVMDITFVAQIRATLHPLTPRIPGFVALMATVPKPPLIKYRLDFGKALGGSMAPAAVTPVINFFLREIITKILVWPQRLVVPIIQETEQDKVEIQKLMRRHRGVIRVTVVNAKELKPDSWGSNDLLAELTTDSEHYEATTIRRAKPSLDAEGKAIVHLGENVTWNEDIYLLVQEPTDQLLRMELFDIDKLRPSKLLTGQVSQVVNGRQLLGRSLVKLADVCRQGMKGSAEPVGLMTHVGSGEWGSAGGPGKGLGKVRLQMTYWPFERFTKYDVENAMSGIVTVRLLRVWGLAVAGDKVSAFVRVTSSAKGKEWRSSTRTWTRRNHVLMLKREMARLAAARERDIREGRSKEAERKARYLEALKDAVAGKNKRARLTVDMDYTLDSNALHAIYHVKLTDMIKIKVIESNLLASDECLGRLDIPVSDIVTANDYNPMTGQREFGLHRKRWEEYNPEQPDRTIDKLERGLLLEEGDGARIWVEMRWVPCIQGGGFLGAEEDEFGAAAAAAAVSPPPPA